MMSRLVSFLQQLAPAVGFKKISLLKTWRLTDKKRGAAQEMRGAPFRFLNKKRAVLPSSEILYTPSQKFVQRDPVKIGNLHTHIHGRNYPAAFPARNVLMIDPQSLGKFVRIQPSLFPILF